MQQLTEFRNDTARFARRLIEICSYLGLAVSLCGCAARVPEESTSSVSWALSRNLTLTDDTFVNSIRPDNNNGASDSIYTGVNGQGGVMRGLVRFAMPPALEGRVTVTNVKLSMTTRALGSGLAGPALVQSLQAVTQAWVQGNGVGDVSTLNTVGQICGGSVTGVTWNQSDCVGSPGSGTTWSTPGGTVSPAISGQATTPGAINTIVTWDSAAGGNAGMNIDVQNWIDTPVTNNGWRISSSDEVTSASAQRFYSSESGAANAPSLALSYNCKAGFDTVGSDCTTCTTAANAKCVTAQGNTCVDSGAPSITYSCNCSNPAYKAGVDLGGAPACLDNNECLPNHCLDGGDATAICSDNAAPATGYGCTCGSSSSFNGVTCVVTSSGGTGGTSGTGGDSSSSTAGDTSTGGASGNGGFSNVAGSGVTGGNPGSGGFSNVAGNSATGGHESVAGGTGSGGTSSTGGVITGGRSAGVAGSSTAAAGQTGALTGGTSATGGLSNQAGTNIGSPTGGKTATADNTGGFGTSSSSSSSGEAIDGGGCGCRVDGRSRSNRLPGLVAIAAVLGLLSRRLHR